MEELTIGYEKPLVSYINIIFRSPTFVQVMGPNGAGKTTLFRTIIGTLRPLKGRVLVDGDDITGNPEKAGKYISYVPQIATYTLSNMFPITVWEFVEFETWAYAKRAGYGKGDVVKLVKEILDEIAIPRDLWGKSVGKLSGGQRQRLLIARALLKRTPIVVMDEPLSAIDIEGKAIVANIVDKLKNEGRIVIVSCHDPELLLEKTDYIVLLGYGDYVVGKPEEVLRLSVLEKFYRGSLVKYDKHIHICDHHM